MAMTLAFLCNISLLALSQGLVKYNRALKASSQEIHVCVFSLNQMFEGFFELSRVCQIIPLSVVKILCYDRENDLLRIIQYLFLAQLGMRN